MSMRAVANIAQPTNSFTYFSYTELHYCSPVIGNVQSQSKEEEGKDRDSRYKIQDTRSFILRRLHITNNISYKSYFPTNIV